MFSRRAMLAQGFNGIGTLGLAAALGHRATAAEPLGGAVGSLASPLLPQRPHFAAKAKHVIHLWMNGAPSQVDTFDPKPALETFAGQRPESTAKLTTENATGGLMPSPFKFSKCGQSGIEISDLFPEVARFADDLCVIRSMQTDVPVHESSNWMMFTGSIQPNRPSYGSWLLYGLGSENGNLPGFVVLGEQGQPVNGPSNWSNRFLPGIYQGCQVALPQNYNPREVIPFLQNAELSPVTQRRELDLIQRLNAMHTERRGAENAMNARIQSLEMAFQMENSAADAFDTSQETASTMAEYGLTGTESELVATGVAGGFKRSTYGRNCLLARRLVERGVRVVQIYCGKSQPWDHHSRNTESHLNHARVVDRPIAALLGDLKQRGLLADTLVLWGGEFGRTPTSQGKDGRDHNHHGFTVWLAGGGVKGGLTYGATDEFGFKAVENPVHVHDLHATMLHLMGLDHEKLTYRYSGRDFRLTDVHGRIVQEIIA
ncbi:MAG: DUF1501 domain-containing protein [Planctomycetales bacterium]|nr:DUF1501 domain-containing protein [Planctomycetales bacterium]